MSKLIRGYACRSRRPYPPRTLLRALGAALLAGLVLAGGSLEIHPAAESHDTLGSVQTGGDVYFPAASHPAQPRHAEAARQAQRPACAICLNRLQNVGNRPTAAVTVAAALASGALPLTAANAPLQRSLRPDGARAPPSTFG